MSNTTLYEIFRTTKEATDPASHLGIAKLPKRDAGTDERLTSWPFENFANAKGACVSLARSWQIEADMIEIDYHQPTSGMFQVLVDHKRYANCYFISYVYHKDERVYTVTFTTRARSNKKDS
jgi:hypothetical protein